MNPYRLGRGLVALLLFISTALLLISSLSGTFDATALLSVYVKPVLLVIAFFLVALGVGSRLWTILRLPSHFAEDIGFGTRPPEVILKADEFLCFASLIGLCATGYAIFFLALLKCLNGIGVSLLFVILGIWGAPRVKHLLEFAWARFHVEPEVPRKRLRLGNRLLYDLLIPSLLVATLIPALLVSLQPPSESDALRYHLAVPEVYVHNGGWIFLPYNSFSNFPFTIEMLYAVPILCGIPQAANVIHFLFFLLLIYLVYLMARRMLGVRPARLAAALLASTPHLPILAGWAFIEAALAAVQFATLYALILWDAHFDSPQRDRFLRMAGVFLGLSLAIKYTSVFLAAFVVLWIFYTLITKRPKIKERPLKTICDFCLLASIVASPWYLKNLVLFGNPLYPLLGDRLGWGEWSATDSALYKFHMSMKGGLLYIGSMGFFGKIVDFLTLPYRMTVAPTEFGGWPIGVLFVPGSFILFFRRRLPSVLKRVLLLCFGLFVVWAYTYRDTRFLATILAVLSVAIAVAVEPLLRKKEMSAQIVGFIVGVGLISNFVSYATNLFQNYASKPYLTGRMSTEEYLPDRLGYLEGFSQLKEISTRPEYVGAKALFVGEHRGLYCPTDYVASDWFDTPAILRLLSQTRDNEAFFQELKNQGIGLIFYNEGELAKYVSPWFVLRFLPDENALTLLRIARKEGTTLNEDNPKQWLLQQAQQTQLWARFQAVFLDANHLTPLWENREGLNIFGVK